MPVVVFLLLQIEDFRFKTFFSDSVVLRQFSLKWMFRIVVSRNLLKFIRNKKKIISYQTYPKSKPIWSSKESIFMWKRMNFHLANHENACTEIIIYDCEFKIYLYPFIFMTLECNQICTYRKPVIQKAHSFYVTK